MKSERQHRQSARLMTASVAAACAAFPWLIGCSPGGVPLPPGGGGTVPADFTNADTARGGRLYDKWWSEAGVAPPTTDHPRWATRPDQTSNTRTGSDTWRCKECHGWDYKGVDGAYGSGSHRTGIAGLYPPSLTAQAVFDELKTGHSFGSLTDLTDSDLWDLTKFVLEGQIDTADIIGAGGDRFSGSATSGQPLYETNCMACHGADGLAIPPTGEAEFSEFVGLISNENPWEFQHKVRFGQAGHPIMPATFGVLTNAEVSDLGAYAQTLPQQP